MFSSPNIWLISLMSHLFNITLRTIMPKTSQSYTLHSLDLFLIKCLKRLKTKQYLKVLKILKFT